MHGGRYLVLKLKLARVVTGRTTDLILGGKGLHPWGADPGQHLFHCSESDVQLTTSDAR